MESFVHETCFEWLRPYSSLRPHQLTHLDPSAAILHLGCGSSNLAFDLFDDGRRNITNVDYAGNVITRMRSLALDRYGDPAAHQLTWIEADCLNLLSLPASAFDAVVDKSTVDAIACGDEDAGEGCLGSKLRTLCEQVGRVARPSAVWVSVSYSAGRRFDTPTWVDEEGVAWKWVTEEVNLVEVPQVEKESKPHVHTPKVFHHVYINRKITLPREGD